MDISVVHPSELGAGDLAGWRAVQDADERLSSPFLDPEFTAVVGRLRSGARVTVLRDGARTAYFPHERHRGGVGRPIGMGMADCEAVVSPAGLPVDGPLLLEASGLLLWRFHHLLAHQASAMAPEAACVASPLIALDRGFDSYIEERRRASKTLLESTARKARKLAREVGEVRLEPDEPGHGVLDLLIRWKREQYRSSGVPDVLARPGATGLLHRLLECRDGRFAAVLSVLYVADRPVVAHMGLRSATGLAWWLPAYDPEYARYSPGIILTLRLAEWAAGQGITWIDLGKGDEPYKQRLKSTDLLLADGWLSRPLLRRPYQLLRKARTRVVAGGRPRPATSA